MRDPPQELFGELPLHLDPRRRVVVVEFVLGRVVPVAASRRSTTDRKRARSLGASGMQLLPFREHLDELRDATGARLGFLGVLDTEQNGVTVA
jgi:hypothetical protein